MYHFFFIRKFVRKNSKKNWVADTISEHTKSKIELQKREIFKDNHKHDVGWTSKVDSYMLKFNNTLVNFLIGKLWHTRLKKRKIKNFHLIRNLDEHQKVIFSPELKIIWSLSVIFFYFTGGHFFSSVASFF